MHGQQNIKLNFQCSFSTKIKKSGCSLLPYEKVYIKLCKTELLSVVSYDFESVLVTLNAEYR